MPGTGWLGIAVDDTVLTGRLVVVEVAAGSPAAEAGVRQQDVLLAINGGTIQTADEMAAALAAISPGQRVKVAVGRDNKIDDLVMTAAPRPAEAMARTWQSSGATTPAARVPTPATDPRPGSTIMNPPIPSIPPDPRTAATVLPPGVAPAPAVGTFSAPVQPLPPSGVAQPTMPAIASPAVLPTASVATAAVAPQTASSHAGGRVALGVRTVPVDSAVQSRFNMTDSRGAFVIGVVADLPAAKAGVPPGSVIVALDQQPVVSPQELTRLVTRGPVGTPVTLHYVLPGGQPRQASVVLQSLDEPLERALVGGDVGLQQVVPAPLQSLPPPGAQQMARRPETAQRSTPDDGGQFARMEETLRRLEAKLEQLDRRLEDVQPSR